MAKDNENPEQDKAEIWQDPRFSHLVSDPRFHQLPKSVRKVKIDRRFQSMFSDDKFRVKYSSDKYGRKLNKSSSEDLKKYYEQDSSSDEEQQDEEKRKEAIAIAKDDEDDGNNDALEEPDLPSNIVKKLNESGVDYARGEGRIMTDSSSDEESSEDENDELYIEHVWGELDNDAPETEQSTRRLAACNMDWDRIRASDIMVLCNSFLPLGGSVLSVSIYPSEFGKQRLVEEDVHGPPELTRNAKDPAASSESDEEQELVKEDDSDAEEGDDYHMEKLRQYQLNRLKYYYAVIECDTVETADKLYAECDGIEYESSATKLDLRFIPDDTTFDGDEPKDVCTELPDLNKYQPRLFTTTALQQAKVELTWDETNVDRKELGDKLSSGKIADVSDAELRKVVAYSSEEESDVEKSPKQNESDSEIVLKEKDSISKYKSLLQEINKKESDKARNKYEMEYTWGINNDSEKKSKSRVVEKKAELTPIEKALQKKSEKNKRRKEERRLKKKDREGNDDEAVAAYSSDDMPADVDLNDPYFAEEFANGDFEKPASKKTKKMKTKSPHSDDDEDEQKSKELELLLDDCQDDKQHFNLKKIQEAESETKSKKRRKNTKKSRQEIESAKSEPQDNFTVNIKDDRFGAVYTSHLFNIDPTDPHFKKTRGMDALIQEKFERRQRKAVAGDVDRDEDTSSAKRPRKNVENSILIKNIKKNIMGINRNN